MSTRLFTVTVALLSVVAPGRADDAQIKRQAMAKAQLLNDATVKKDWAKFADLTHPNVVRLAGGREKMLSLMEQGVRESQENGVEILSAKVGEASDLVRRDRQLFIVVNFEMKMKVVDGKLISYGYVVGVSDDDGKNWAFVNSSTRAQLKEVLPNLPDALKLPDPKPPINARD